MTKLQPYMDHQLLLMPFQGTIRSRIVNLNSDYCISQLLIFIRIIIHNPGAYYITHLRLSLHLLSSYLFLFVLPDIYQNNCSMQQQISQIKKIPAMKQVTKNNSKITDYFKSKGIREPVNNVPPLTRVLHPATKLQKLQQKNNSKPKDQNNRHKNKQIEIDIESEHTQPLQNMQKVTQKMVTCKQLIFIGPCNVQNYSQTQKKLLDLKEAYTKSKFVSFVLQNARKHRSTNLKILLKIQDKQFWEQTAPKMIQYALQRKKQNSISSNLPIFVANAEHFCQISKAQILMMIINMFLVTIPDQTHKSYLSFAYLMCAKQNGSQQMAQVKQQKLRCIINYLVVMMKRNYSQLEYQFVSFRRVVNYSDRQQIVSKSYPMEDVTVKIGKIQQYYKKSIMVDFANKNIGGGVLTNGAAQEQILFCVFPQLIITICLFQQMGDNQAIIVQNAQKINDYSGYSNSFKFEGTYAHNSKQKTPYKSIIVAIDAIDFSNKLGKGQSQYTVAAILRELSKAFIGIQGAEMFADSKMEVCTGRWGCGVYKGDSYFKFTIQWIACSLANRKMIYMAKDDEEMKQLKVMAKFLGGLDTSVLIDVLKQYHVINKGKKKISFLQFIKKQIS